LALKIANGIKFLQVNLNRHWAAQNLLMQSVHELNINIVCVSEPASAPRFSPWWAVSFDGLAAIYCKTRNLAEKCVTYR